MPNKKELFYDKEGFKNAYTLKMERLYGISITKSDAIEKYLTLGLLLREYRTVDWAQSRESIIVKQKKQLHYFSMEFLMGRLLLNNLMNLNIYDIVKDGLAELGIDLEELIQLEPDPGLGNGGLGRLAACFLDSLASLHYPAYGHTIRYAFGLFKQKIVNGYQIELPDHWQRMGYPWEVRDIQEQVSVKFFGSVNYNIETKKYEYVDYDEIYAVPYDVLIIGKNAELTNTLRLWSAEVSDNISSVKDFRQYINEVEEICQLLYPDDSTMAGKTLRLKQEYFFTSAGIQSIVNAHLKQYGTLDNFHEKNVIQLNDTHPVLAIPKLMEILMDEHAYSWDDAWHIVSHTFAYTNHTLLKEALEVWPISLMETLLPRIYMIIDEIHRRFIRLVEAHPAYSPELLNRVYILKDGFVHMAHIAIVTSFSVNGVAKLHTQIMVDSVLEDFYRLFPGKFNNKTNGVTHRRWLVYSNPQLSNLITEYIGDNWITHPNCLKELMYHVDDPKLQSAFLAVKRQAKQKLADYILETQGIEISVDSIFDVQIKRFHAYKRQLLNVLQIIYTYLEMKRDPDYRIYPTTYIFAGKAASNYYFAKKVIKLVHSVAEVVNNDAETNAYLKVVFVENYGISIAEKIIPAADVSEQISTAGKEASGTGNMKMMMNGAITLGTLDGANIEIVNAVGKENAIIFGLTRELIAEIQVNQTYHAWDIYHNEHKIMKVINSLIDGTFHNNTEEFRMIYEELMNHNDEYFVFADFSPCLVAHERVNELYQNPQHWARMALINIAKSGYFSSDRTIKEYADDIWKLEPLDLTL